MKCPKCQHINPDDTLFCEECDHRMDQPGRVRENTLIQPLYGVLISLAAGLMSVIFSLVVIYGWYIPVVLGAVGLMLGSYSLTVTRRTAPDNQMMLTVLAMAGMALSVVGFVYGITLS